MVKKIIKVIFLSLFMSDLSKEQYEKAKKKLLD